MTGVRYEICRGCGRKWNVSVLARVPWYGYTCPICRAIVHRGREPGSGTSKTKKEGQKT